MASPAPWVRAGRGPGDPGSVTRFSFPAAERGEAEDRLPLTYPKGSQDDGRDQSDTFTFSSQGRLPTTPKPWKAFMGRLFRWQRMPVPSDPPAQCPCGDSRPDPGGGL